MLESHLFSILLTMIIHLILPLIFRYDGGQSNGVDGLAIGNGALTRKPDLRWTRYYYPRNVEFYHSTGGYAWRDGIYSAMLWYRNVPVYMKFNENGEANAALMYIPFRLKNRSCSGIWFLVDYDSFQNLLNEITDLPFSSYFDSLKCGVRQLESNYYASGKKVGHMRKYGGFVKAGDSLQPKLVDVRFHQNDYKIGPLKPFSMQTQTLVNHSGRTQIMALTEKYVTARTDQWDHKVGFEFSIGVGFDSSFNIMGGTGGFSMDVSFSFGGSVSFGHGTTSTQITEQTHRLPAAAGKTATGKLIVQKGKVSMPYSLVFEVDGHQFTVSGVWRGVGYSSTRYVINTNAN